MKTNNRKQSYAAIAAMLIIFFVSEFGLDYLIDNDFELLIKIGFVVFIIGCYLVILKKFPTNFINDKPQKQ